MPTIHVEPLGIDIPTDEPCSIMAAARIAGYDWPTICNGRGQCTACYVRVTSNPHHLSPETESEREALGGLGLPPVEGEPYRLACQAVVTGHVTVFKRGVRPK